MNIKAALIVAQSVLVLSDLAGAIGIYQAGFQEPADSLQLAETWTEVELKPEEYPMTLLEVAEKSKQSGTTDILQSINELEEHTKNAIGKEALKL